MKLIKTFIAMCWIAAFALFHTAAHAGALTDYAENKIVDDLFRTTSYSPPATYYVGLVLQSAGCTDSSAGTEVSGGSYARVAITKGDAYWQGTHGSTTGASSGTNGTINNASAITFPAATADWGNVGYFAIYDASTSGNMIICSALTAQRNITTGSTPSFAGSALTIQIDN
jgi:hypothetical protein